MAGYIMSLKDKTSLNECFKTGIYSTNLAAPKQYTKKIENFPNGYWSVSQEGTLADYSSMKAGDNIYFFIDRKIYGVGILINIGQDCKFNNFPNASVPNIFEYEDIQDKLLIDLGTQSINNRWLCIFKPDNFFFKEGIDMDDVLSSNPSKFKMLRAFWKLSFIKIDDEENKALKDIFLQNNEHLLSSNESNNFFEFNDTYHKNILNKLNKFNYALNIKDILNSCSTNNHINHEMALECGTVYQIANAIGNTTDIFGEWDYISHQVIASPFKPIDYMDKMDIFGYKYIENYPGTISKYFVAELKKDSAQEKDIEQLELEYK